MVFLRSGDGPKFDGTLKDRGQFEDVVFLEIVGDQGRVDLVGVDGPELDGSREVLENQGAVFLNVQIEGEAFPEILDDQGAVCVGLCGSHVENDDNHRVVDKVWHGVESDLVRNIQTDVDLKPKSCVKNLFFIFTARNKRFKILLSLRRSLDDLPGRGLSKSGRLGSSFGLWKSEPYP